MRQTFLLLGLTVLSALVCHAQQEDTRQRIISPEFHTLKVENPDNFLSAPVITLGGDDRITVSFDEFTTDRSYLCYSLYHCNADWQPSQLLDSEYVSGFNKADVEDFGYSRTTFQQYVNYRITIPSEGMQPLVSGNYLLKVYPEDDPGETLLQTRFSVNEGIVAVDAEASIHTDRGSDGTVQQLDIALDTRSLQGIDPFSELIIAVEQNGVPQSRVLTSTPLRVEPSRIVYSHNTDLIFPSGNEWRRFETVRADYPGLHTDSTRYRDDRYQAYLTPDEGRADKPYTYDRTQFGRFKIREYNSTDSDLGADYVDTHFTLDFPQVMNADIYIDGEFTGHLALPEYQMRYDTDNHLYRATVPLKQGSYNYRYVAIPRDGKGGPEPSLIEGDKAETINEYRIQVFVRKHGSRADRLVADTIITTSL